MNWRFVLRIVILLAFLLASVNGIIYLNSSDGKKFFESLGFENQTENFVSWCTTRVQSLSLYSPNGFQTTLKEENRRWVVKSQAKADTLPYLDIERWLGAYCQVEVTKDLSLKESVSLPLTPILVIEFIDGTKTTLYKVGTDFYQLQGRVFASPELEKGLLELQPLLSQ